MRFPVQQKLLSSLISFKTRRKLEKGSFGENKIREEIEHNLPQENYQARYLRENKRFISRCQSVVALLVEYEYALPNVRQLTTTV
jgi:hypothetical protein